MAYFGYHAFQSFAEGEVTPEIAHEIGVKLAEELWGDRFEVIVTTHLNTNHIHNHFCINSVSFKDGKKYYNNRYTYAMLRNTSDSICREYNLSVLKEKPCGKHNIDYTKYYKEQVNKLDYYNTVKDDIDYAIEQAYSYSDFLNIMKKMNYEVLDRAGKLSIKPVNRKRNIRIERAFGDRYTIENINQRIFETESTRLPFPEVRISNKRYKLTGNQKINKKKKTKGIRALYFHYCYLLKVYPKTNTKRVMSKSLREDIKKMDKLSNEARFLSKTKIETAEELNNYKSSSILKNKELKSKKEYLWKKYNKSKSEDEKQSIINEIQQLSSKIKKLNEEQKMIEDIESRIPNIKEKLKEINESESKNRTEKERSN